MKRFKNILVYLSGCIGEDQALTRAVELARANHARLTLIDVLVPINGSGASSFWPPSADKMDLDQQAVQERLAVLRRMADCSDLAGVDVDFSVGLGRPFIEIIRKVLTDSHDLVVMAADSLQGLRLIVLGATSMHLMRKCPCPVWVIKPKKEYRFTNILAAIDARDQNEAGTALNTKVLQLASSLARREQCNLHISYAWRFEGSDAENVKSEISETMMDDLYKKNHKLNKALVLRALEGIELGNVEPQIHLPCGDPARVVPEVAEQNHIDLIVMGTVSRSGVSGLLMGNTAELVLQQVNCSVLTAKPDGFESPVTVE